MKPSSTDSPGLPPIILRDQATMRLMVSLYTRHHLGQSEPSAEYQRLADYACQRLARCRYGEQKPACKDCPVHCYRPDMREEVRCVMRWAGPRMILYAPRATMRHLWQSVKAKIYRPQRV